MRTSAVVLLSALLAALAIALPLAASAHEVQHEVERGRAVAVRAHFHGGEPLADSAYEVFSPAEPKVPYQQGRTDRRGWLAFVPDAAGAWRVRIADASGHGAELTVDTAALPAAPAAPPSSAAFVLRPLVGLLAVGAVFAALFALWRRPPSPR